MTIPSIVPIEINTSDILSQFSLDKDQIEQMLDNVAKGLGTVFVTKVEQIAARDLNSTRSRYLNSIKVIDSGKLESTILLDYSKDKMIKMIEEGAAPFDMKENLLNGPNAKLTKEGKRINTVPFRWSTPGAIGESSLFSGKMPEEIYEAVRKKPMTIPTAGGGTRSQGLSTSQIPQNLQPLQTRKAILGGAGEVLFKEYEHKYPVYSGIVKQSDSVTGQSTYFSFRRVSENSSPEAFIHPGIAAKNIMQKAYESMNLDQEVGIQIDNELIRLGF